MESEKIGVFRVVLWVIGILVSVFLVAPIIIVMITSLNEMPYMEFPPHRLSLRWYRNFFTSPHWFEPALLSVRVAFATAVSAAFLGTLAAIGIGRGQFRSRRALEMFFVSPLVVPVVVLALGLYLLFSSLHVLGTPLALYLGHTVIATPLVIVIVLAAVRTADPEMELAARSLGAGYMSALWRVTIPIIRPAILSGTAFAFLISFDEVIIAIFLGGPDATTLPKRMWETIRFEIDPTLTAISSLLTCVAVLILVGAEGVRRTFQGRSAR